MFPITSHFVIHSNYLILLITTHSTTLGEPDQQTIADEVVIIKHMKVELARWWLGRGGVQTDDGRAVEVVGGEGVMGEKGWWRLKVVIYYIRRPPHEQNP